MNIFVLDKNPAIAAQYHCDKHVIKLIVEAAQMLSTAIRYFGIDCEGLYKSIHLNHPCTQWVIKSRSNAEWLLQLGFDLCDEYYLRYSNIHKTYNVLKEIRDNQLLLCIPDIGMTPFVQAMPDKYKNDYDVVKAYRNYYMGEKRSFAKWKIKKPEWFI